MACGEVTLLELGKVRSTKRGSRRAALVLQRLRWLAATCVRACCSILSGSLWQLDPAAPGSHDEDYVYPIGFRTCRKHASAANPGSKCLYHSEIVAGPQGVPQFKVTCADMSEHSYEDSTPNVRVICGMLVARDLVYTHASRPKNGTQPTQRFAFCTCICMLSLLFP